MTDVFIAGGGPAGLGAAIAARIKGLRVVVADPALPPIDKACGEGLMPDSLVALNRLGVQIGDGDGYPFRGIRFLGDGTSVDASFPHGFGIGVRRTVLHRLLMERAEQLGVELRWGKRVTAIRDGAAEMDDLTIRCKWIIGADGQTSRVRQWAGLQYTRRESRRYGFRRHYRIAPWTDCVEVHWGENCQVYITPVGTDEVGVALVSRDSHLRLDTALAAFPSLSMRLQRVEYSSTERGAISLTRSLRQVSRGRTALIGDASGSVDAVTGEGLGLAFQQAIALADAIVKGNLADYGQAHRAISRRPAMMGRLLLLMDRFPFVRRCVLRALDSRTEVFGKLLALHVGGGESRSDRRTVFQPAD